MKQARTCFCGVLHKIRHNFLHFWSDAGRFLDLKSPYRSMRDAKQRRTGCRMQLMRQGTFLRSCCVASIRLSCCVASIISAERVLRFDLS
ncbi:hypothetical protein Y032_0286g1404 [Ancylostoma ceylanicum]|uniref:Uncharacterized protein n=1 Tax=Ancylostoma ceylanicum TaxID=53326 RepID=A0A016S5Z5_9BILA|nr:hypothetical protein Y032_0286g1404 [Ancylostoma ceylanicum]